MREGGMVFLELLPWTYTDYIELKDVTVLQEVIQILFCE